MDPSVTNQAAPLQPLVHPGMRAKVSSRAAAGMGQFFGAALNTAVGAFAGGGVLGLGGAAGAGGSDLARFQELINQQIQVQAEMQAYSSLSNIEKTRHETAMTAIRNMRA